MNTSSILRRIAASVALAALPVVSIGSLVALPSVASAQDMGGMGMHHHGFTRRPGNIASFNGSSFTLDDGTTIFLHQGTVILPTGRPLHAGQHVFIDGFRDGRGRINADRIVIGRRYR
jgi:hypothetical protein